jgi:hypothetical protein
MDDICDVFLSHSHADTRAVKALAGRWGPSGFGNTVLADFMDPQLVEASRAGTMDAPLADHLRRMIRRCRIFVFVASANSATSGWMPWELGLAHGAIGRVHIYRLGAGAPRAFERREYLQLYEATSFDAKNARHCLAQALAQAKADPTNPSQDEVALDQGARIAKAMRQWQINAMAREVSQSPAAQAAWTGKGLAHEAGTSVPSVSDAPRRRR